MLAPSRRAGRPRTAAGSGGRATPPRSSGGRAAGSWPFALLLRRAQQPSRLELGSRRARKVRSARPALRTLVVEEVDQDVVAQRFRRRVEGPPAVHLHHPLDELAEV